MPELEQLRQSLDAAQPEDRALAATDLGSLESPSPEVLELLLSAALDTDELVRWRVFAAFGNLGVLAQAAIPVLCAALETGSHFLRLQAWQALQSISPASSFPRPAWTGAAPYPRPVYWLLSKYRSRFRNTGHSPTWYGQAFLLHRPLVTRFLQISWSRVVFLTEHGTLLNLTSMYWNPELGQRPFDAPVLSRLTRDYGNMQVTAFEQPRLEDVRSADNIREFHRQIRAQGYDFQNLDPFHGDLGFNPESMQIQVVNYWGVVRVS